MRAAVLRAPQEVVLEDVAVPEPGPGQVLVRLRGGGFQGLLLTQLLRGVAGEIGAISRRRSSLEQALANGASNAYTLDDPALDQLEPFDVVVEATGHQAPLDLAARLTRIRGRLV